MTLSLPPVVILAGGLATRMRPKTKKIPKSMLKIKGEPFISHQLRNLKRKNIKKVILCLGYLGEQIEEYLQGEKNFGLQVTYIYDGEKLLGTGGAIINALDYLPEQFFIIYGDSWLNIDYQLTWKKFISQNKLAMMTVYRNEGSWDTSNVEMEGNKIKLYSKQNQNMNMSYIDYGLNILSKPVLNNYPIGKYLDLSEILESLSKKSDLAAIEIKDRFYEIGSKEGLADLEEHI